MASNIEVEEFIEEMSKKGKPVSSRDIAEKFHINRARAANHLKRLKGRNRIVEVGRGEKGLRLYKHVKYEPRCIIKLLQEMFQRNPTLQEIAYKIGKPPEQAKNDVYSIAEEIGWCEPTEEEIEEGRLKVYILLSTAALLELRNKANKTVKEFFNKYPGVLPPKNSKIIEKAKEYAKKFNNLVPKVIITQKLEEKYIWNKEALQLIGEVDEMGKKPVFWFDWDANTDKIQEEKLRSSELTLKYY